MTTLKRIFIVLSLSTLFACGGGGNTDTTDTTDTTGTTEPTNNNGNPAPQTTGPVINKLETVNGITYKIYLQPEANANNRKGLILLGSGNKAFAPEAGDLNGPLQTVTSEELAKQGYVAAIVSYRKQGPATASDQAWNYNSQEMAKDMNVVAEAIIQANPGLSRDRIITGGSSYASNMLLTNIAMDDSSLDDTRGFIPMCGGSNQFDANSFKIPIFTINCKGADDFGIYGQALFNLMTSNEIQGIKADSAFFEDDACNTHCGGDPNLWAAKFVERAKIWLP